MILVCGGAGYIGSHMVQRLKEIGEDPVVVDNLVTGHRASLPEGVPFHEGDVRDRDFLRGVFEAYDFEGVFHFCAHSLVGESMLNPLLYYDNNLRGTLVLLELMRDFKVPYFIFSSSAAVYGNPQRLPILEGDQTVPKNPYGETKLAMERLLHWAGVAHGVQWIALRYFNVGGSSEDGAIGEDHFPETHLIPILLEAVQGKREVVSVFGDDYETEDGTCIRDYIHVLDVVEGHLRALSYLRAGGSSEVFNLGSGKGYSVKEVISQVKEITGVDFKVEVQERRLGDPAILVADKEKAEKVLGWKASVSDLKNIVESAWLFARKHPGGYDG